MENKLKFLVLGAAGMAGHTISMYLNERGHDVLGFDKSKVTHCNSIVGDAKDLLLIKNLIKKGKYDSVINCIGLLNQFAEQNKELAVYLNSYLPHFLSDVTKDEPTQIIHMSTDCVFSGKKGQYTENDFPDGETFYDRSKALGELNDNKNITLRNSIVGPDLNENGIGLFNWFMKQKGSIKGFAKVNWTGLTTLQLAKIMEHITKVKSNGLINMVNNKSISKYELLLLFNKNIRNNELQIVPTDELEINKSLVRTRFDMNLIVPDYDLMVSEMGQWINAHEKFYPHYKF